MAHGTIQMHEELPATPGEVLVGMVCQDLPRRRRQEPGERGHLLDVLDGDFRVRRRIGVRRDRSAVDGFLHRRKRSRYSHFLRKRPGVEIQQCGYRGFPTEPSDPPINRAAGMASDSIALGAVTTFV